jgi:hypothetical protein
MDGLEPHLIASDHPVGFVEDRFSEGALYKHLHATEFVYAVARGGRLFGKGAGVDRPFRRQAKGLGGEKGDLFPLKNRDGGRPWHEREARGRHNDLCEFGRSEGTWEQSAYEHGSAKGGLDQGCGGILVPRRLARGEIEGEVAPRKEGLDSLAWLGRNHPEDRPRRRNGMASYKRGDPFGGIEIGLEKVEGEVTVGVCLVHADTVDRRT